MKTQFSFHKYGFTLVELMVVITILGLLFVMYSRFSYQPQENLTKAERLANKVSQVLHDGLLQITIGKMAVDPNNSTQPIAVTGAIFTIGTSSGGSCSGITWYYTSTSSGKFLPPFYDKNKDYEIDKIEWTGGTTSGSGNCVQINMTRDVMTFSGLGIATNDTILIITTKYLTMKKKVLFDRRTGRIEVNKN